MSATDEKVDMRLEIDVIAIPTSIELRRFTTGWVGGSTLMSRR